MEYSGQYLTYEEYLALGGTLDLTPFNVLEFEARRKIDIRTFNRLKDSEDIPQEVKLCEYKLIDSLNSYAVANESVSSKGNLASESTDGYSVTYISYDKVGEVIKSKSAELDDIIRTYLLGVIYNGEHLLYRGVE